MALSRRPRPPEQPGPSTSIGPQAFVGQAADRRFAEVMRRMRQRGHPAGPADQVDGLGSLQPRLLDARRAPVAQIPREGIAEARDLAGPCQVVGQVPASEHGAGNARRTASRSTRRPSSSSRTTIASIRRARPARRASIAAARVRLVLADEVSQDVQLATPVFAGQLDPVDQLDAPVTRFGLGHGERRDGVVVGDRQRREPDPRRGDHNLARRAGPVGMRRVDVQVGAPRRHGGDPDEASA